MCGGGGGGGWEKRGFSLSLRGDATFLVVSPDTVSVCAEALMAELAAFQLPAAAARLSELQRRPGFGAAVLRRPGGAPVVFRRRPGFRGCGAPARPGFGAAVLGDGLAGCGAPVVFRRQFSGLRCSSNGLVFGAAVTWFSGLRCSSGGLAFGAAVLQRRPGFRGCGAPAATWLG